MTKPTTFNDGAHEIRYLLKKIDDLEIPRSEIRRQLELLADQRANLLVKMKVLDREADTLQTKARQKMLELTELHASGNESNGSGEKLPLEQFEKE